MMTFNVSQTLDKKFVMLVIKHDSIAPRRPTDQVTSSVESELHAAMSQCSVSV